MLKKRKIQNSQHHKANFSIKSPPLSRFEQIANLERELVNIIGTKNIEVDEGSDLFSRLEEIYINHLQSQPMGVEVLEKIIHLIGDADPPIKIRMMYLLAHQLYIHGQSPLPVLQEGFQCNLNMKTKMLEGYNCGLVLIELTMCPRTVQNILSSLIVSLEEEVGFKANGQKQVKQRVLRNSSSCLKSIYLGGRTSSKGKIKTGYFGKVQKLKLSKCLFEAYQIGSQRLQSQAKKRYYQDCQEELARKIIRQNPGINIRDKLIAIQNGETVLKEFKKALINASPKIKINKKEEFSRTDPEQMKKSIGKRRLSQQIWSKTSNGFEHRQKIQQQSLHLAQSAVLSNKSNIHFQKSCQVSKRANSGSSRHESTKRKIAKENQSFCEKQNDEKEIKKSIVLKFDRLKHSHHENKLEIRKRKIKGDIHWEEKPSHNTVQNVLSVNYSPIKKEVVQEIACQTEYKEKKSESVKIKEEDAEVLESLMLIGTSEASARRIDMLLEEEVENMKSYTQVEPNSYKKVRSATGDKKSTKRIKHPVFVQTNLHEEKIKLAKDEGIAFTQTVKSIKEEQCIEVDKSTCKQIDSKMIEEDEIIGSLVDLKKKGKSISSRSEESIQYKIVINNEEGNLLKESSETAKIIPSVDRYLEEVTLHCNTPQFIATIPSQKEPHEQIFEKEQSMSEKDDLEKISQKDEGSQKDEKVEANEYFSKEEQIDKVEEDKGDQIDEEEKKSALSENTVVRDSLIEIVDLKSSQQKLDENHQENIQSTLLKTQEQADKLCFKKTESTDIRYTVPEKMSKQQIALETNELIDDELNEMFEDIVLDASKKIKKKATIKESDDYQNRTSLSEDSKSEHHEKRIYPIEECDDSYSFDNKDKSSEAHSYKNKDSDSISSPFTPQSRSEFKKKSNFTWSRFAGSKIDCESLNTVSQNMIIEEFIKNMDGQNDKKELVVTEPGVSLKGIRSRSQSQKSKISSNNLLKLNAEKRQSSQLSAKLSESFDTELSEKIRFDHWLSPLLSISPSTISFKISYAPKGNFAEKREKIPVNLSSRSSIFKAIESDIAQFLEKCSESESDWQSIKQGFESLTLIPDKIKLLTLEIPKQSNDQDIQVEFYLYPNLDEVRCSFSSKELKANPISLLLNGSLEIILENLTPSKMRILDQKLLIEDLWTKISKRSIKLLDKYENTTVNCKFDVYEYYSKEEDTFSYEIRGENNEQMNFGFIDFNLRNKVINNIDTIIATAIKLINKKVCFNHENINHLISLL